MQLPFALLPVLHFTNSRELMGDFKNGKIVRTVVWAVAILVLVVNVVLVLDFVLDEDNPTPHTWWFYTICFAIGVAYFGFIAYLMKNEFLSVYHWFQKHYRQRYQPFNDDKSDYSEEMYEGDDRFGRKSNSPYARFDASEHTEG